ncbi:DUF2785 domain-containing protein [Parvularcula sp. LCG005]|uniref:DUF2785 domain-containing protein n=1 Tax=Parvularcula sp. LCG005 TaxID=3078805 RepID=UPI002942026C|nr:DUF2785 domain-containing protein [Parvularcula sp. LCG005]WOI53552.1 DUF2785 domain-containing protein [Parvularcula sp. LCG005]
MRSACFAIAFCCMGSAHAAECAPLGLDRDGLLELREGGFVIADPAARRTFALDLAACLASPDPVLRDKIAYEGFSALLRGDQLETDTIRSLSDQLMGVLSAPADAAGFEKPFAALVLSEIARTDRFGDTMTPDGLDALVAAAAGYLLGITDYRGYDETDGWRHGVAHGADFAMQLALNDKLTSDQLHRLAAAIAAQTVPDDAHFYIYGEPGRLARPILFMSARNDRDDAYWSDWWAQLTASAAPSNGWDTAYESQAGLAALHNLRAFAQAVYINASLSQNEGIRALLPGAEATLRALP